MPSGENVEEARVATSSDFAALVVDGREIRVSRPGKVFFPDVPVSKMQLVEYYISVGEGALRGVYRRPTVLKRFPDGINGEVFFQKRVPAARPDWLHTATVHFPSGRSAEELCPLDVAHIIWAVNLGCVDFNPWPVRDSDLDCSDELARRPRPDAGGDLRRCATRRRLRPRCPRRARYTRVPKDFRQSGDPYKRAYRTEVGLYRGEARCARIGKGSREDGCPRSRPPSGGKRSEELESSSTTTRTPATIRSPPRTRSDRCPTPGSQRRSPGTNWTGSTPTS